MTFGVTAAGFVTKRLADIKGEIEAALKATFGNSIDLTSESPLGQITGIFSEREALLWELAEGVYYSQYPDTAAGVPLDNAAALTGSRRQPAAKGHIIGAIFKGTAGTVIPKDSVVSVSGNADARFVTDVAMTIAAAIDEIQHIAFSAVPASGTWSLTFSGQTTSALAFNANATAVQTALRLLTNLSNDLTVTGDYTAGFNVNFLGADGGINQPLMTSTDSLLTGMSVPIDITITESVAGSPAQVIGNLTAESTGVIHAEAGTLTVIETPVSGWDSISNPTSANVGRDVETDPAFKLRRNQSLRRAGAATVDAIRADVLEVPGVSFCSVLENITMVTDIFGLPPKSFVAVVVGGVDADIAEAIWLSKPAGIETFGLVTVPITDSQGIVHDVKFSRPDELDIWVELDLTVDGTYPGDSTVIDAILGYGLSLSLGDDVIVYPKLISTLGPIPGILDVVLRIGTAPSPTLDDNIPVPDIEIAAFSASRILVTIL